ncbi:MAG: alkaline phosphatase family protein [Bryobacteraceae bacterium]
MSVAIRVLVAVAGAAGLLFAQTPAVERAGPRSDGSFLLNSGWLVQPAGTQIPVGTFPMNSVLSSDGKYLVVLNGGYAPPTLSVIDSASAKEIHRAPAPDAWFGLVFSRDGQRLYVSGGSQASVYEYEFAAGGRLIPARTFEIVAAAQRTSQDFIGDVAISPDGRLIYAASLYRNHIAVINPQSGRVIERFRTGRRPYRILFHPDGKSLFVTNWADGTLHHLDALNGSRLGAVRLGPHPTDLVWHDKAPVLEEDEKAPWAARIFVAAANTNRIFVVGISDSKDLRQVETLNLAMQPYQPLGMTPSALALSPAQDRLYIVCSDANAVAVADVTQLRSRVRGYVPSGWYPTAARALPDGRLVILNGRGGGSQPNPKGPNPLDRAARPYRPDSGVQHVSLLQTGTLSMVPPFDDGQLAAYSRTVLRNTPYRDEIGDVSPAALTLPGGIEHVIYIVKEGRTYDQILGDLGKGRGDPALTRFGEPVAPNHRKLAREFVLLDNFYTNGDAAADGIQWSTAAIASDYVQRIGPNMAAGRRPAVDEQGREPLELPPAAYLWTNAASAGIPLRNYGFMVTNNPPGAAQQVQVVRDSTLRTVTSLTYRGPDPEYPDVERAKAFLDELKGFEAEGRMPKLILVRLGNDDCGATRPSKRSAMDLMADNDQALGMIVEAVSRSSFWPRTAIFVVEASAEDGADHVDSHRAPAYVLSPYTRRGAVDSSMYNTASVLRTIGLILGLRPMTHFDAAARPMSAAFTDSPNPEPYSAAVR